MTTHPLARKSEEVIYIVQRLYQAGEIKTPTGPRYVQTGWRNVYGDMFETRKQAREVAKGLSEDGGKYRVARFEMTGAGK